MNDYTPHSEQGTGQDPYYTENTDTTPREKKKGVIARFIERLARENQQNLGGGGYNCCDLPGKDH